MHQFPRKALVGIYNSPLQVLNAIEILSLERVKLEDALFVILLQEGTVAAENLKMLIEKEGLNSLVIPTTRKLTSKLVPYWKIAAFFFGKKLTYDVFMFPMMQVDFFAIIGNYSKATDVIFFDEGSHTLEVKADAPLHLSTSERWPSRVKRFLYSCKPMVVSKVYTIFKIDHHGMTPVIPYSYDRLKLKKARNVRLINKTYILGQHLYLREISTAAYLKYLEEIKLSEKSGRLVYVPHRYDTESMIAKVKKLGFEVRPSSVCIEYDLVLGDEIPHKIIGFTSSALFTLHLIFKEDQVSFESKYIPTSEVYAGAQGKMNKIYENLKRAGISVIA